MKKILLFVCLVLSSVVHGQQNLVVNGSFEDTVKCPTGAAQVTASCKDWRTYTSGSADYCNSCNMGTAASVPRNLSGYQPAAHGNAYCTIITHMAAGSHYEYIAGKLQPLVPGLMYEVSICVSKSNIYALSTDNIGVYFYNKAPASIPITTILPVKPQIYYSNYGTINDTVNWVQLVQTFIADSAYDNLVIGAFNNANNTYDIDTNGINQSYAFYCIDSVVVKIYDTLLIETTDTLLCAGDTIEFPYLSLKRKQSNNTFTIQLSNSSGSFASPVNIGSITRDTSGTIPCVIPAATAAGTGYRMRIIASNYPDTSEHYLTFKIGNVSIAKPIATNNGPICDFDTLKLSASSSTSGVSYSWTGPESYTSKIQNPTLVAPNTDMTGEYIVKAYIHGCENFDTTDVVVSRIGDMGYPIVVSNEPLCTAGDTMKLYSITSTATTYSWTGPGNFTSSLKNPERWNLNTNQSGWYKLRASNSHCTLDDSVLVNISQSPEKPVTNNNSPVCDNDSIRLFATCATQGVSYSWTGPASYTSNLQNPRIEFPSAAKAGNYIVTVTINGCTNKDTSVVTLYGASGPTGVLATGTTPICENDTLKLFGAANGSGNVYTWTGPNGFSSMLQNPVIPAASMTAAGSYLLKASNGACSTTHAINIIVKPQPANFNASYNSPVCEGKQVLFNASSTSTGVIYSWTGPNSFFYNGPSPTIGAAATIHSGNYIATGLLNGCTIKDTVVFSAKPTPVTPTVSNNGPVCEGDTLKLNGATTTSGVTYAWAGPNSFVANTKDTAVGNTHTGMSGNYTLTATLDGCSASATTAVTVKPLPAPVTLSANSPVCEGSTLQFSATASTTGATYNWTGPNSFAANTQNSSITGSTTAATGWYKMNVGLNGCFYRDSIPATVNIIPAAPAVSYNSPICVGETLTLTPTSIAGATYSWIGANGYSSAQQNATRSNMQVADAGQYKVNATLNGCTSPDGTVTVGVNPTPFVVIFSNPIDSICQGNNVLFTAIPNNHGGTPAFRWLVNGLAAGTGNTFNTATLSDKDIISCEMTENTKCSVPYTDASNDVTMTVLPWMAPSVSIKANPATPLQPAEFVTFTATATNADISPGYQWKRNGQNIVGATGSVWSANTLNDNDEISVVVTSKYRCPQPLTAASNSIKVRVLTGIKDINNTGGIALYPNPNKGSFVLKGSNSVQAMTIEVMNTMGQVVYREELQPTGDNWQKEINMNPAAAGTYLLKVKANDGTTTMKFTVR